ncbi:MAG: HK97 family phage prohead protease [Synergistaceae bacterium]|nr:HK97 family phage prohead protease [Synergistaceae bacterium]
MPKKKENEIERRYFPVEELRAITDEAGLRHITGYAAVFNSLSEDLGYFREKIDPGAFAETINSDDIRALKNHNSDYVLGRNKSGTLTLSEDQRGLKIDVMPPDAQWARDLMVSIDRGDIDQMSFGFQTMADRWEIVDGKEVRTLMKVRLFDVSPVTFPAYPDTEVGLRSLEEHRKAVEEENNESNKADEALIGLSIRRRRLKIKERELED